MRWCVLGTHGNDDLKAGQRIRPTLQQDLRLSPVEMPLHRVNVFSIGS